MVDSRVYATTSNGLSRNRQSDRMLAALVVPAEQALCHGWFEHHDIEAADALVGRYLETVAGIANGYRGRGVSSRDLASEGYVGLMRALCHYDPACDMPFSDYATEWVHACIRQRISFGALPVQAAACGCPREATPDCGDDAVSDARAVYPCGAPRNGAAAFAARRHAG